DFQVIDILPPARDELGILHALERATDVRLRAGLSHPGYPWDAAVGRRATSTDIQADQEVVKAMLLCPPRRCVCIGASLCCFPRSACSRCCLRHRGPRRRLRGRESGSAGSPWTGRRPPSCRIVTPSGRRWWDTLSSGKSRSRSATPPGTRSFCPPTPPS